MISSAPTSVGTAVANPCATKTFCVFFVVSYRRVEALKRTDWVWQFFAYFLPSNIMLPIMWRRRYLDVSDRNVGGIVDDWRLSSKDS